MSKTQQEMSVDEVEVVAVVPPSREPEDVWDVELKVGLVLSV